MPRDERTYIRVHDGMPDHPKVAALSDAAFRLLIETWCWCSRHLTDGRVPAAVWRKRGTAKARAELVVAGLVETSDGEVMMHDYTEHQRTAAEVAAAKAEASESGSRGNHNRWHRDRGRTEPDCRWCSDPPSGTRSRPDPGPDRQPDRKPDRVSVAETETEGGYVGGVPYGTQRAREETPPEPPRPAPGRRPRCARHAGLPDDDPGPPCLACRDARLAAEPPLRPTPTPPPAAAVLAGTPEHNPDRAARGRAATRAALNAALNRPDQPRKATA
jgi:hypothetical protein